MNIEEFCAEHPEHEEIESCRRWARLVSGEYDMYGHATGDGKFCRLCGEEWDDFCCSDPGCEYGCGEGDEDEDV